MTDKKSSVEAQALSDSIGQPGVLKKLQEELKKPGLSEEQAEEMITDLFTIRINDCWYGERHVYSTSFHKHKPDKMFQVSLCTKPLSPRYKEGHVNFFRVSYNDKLSHVHGVRSLSLGPDNVEHLAEAEENIPGAAGYRPMLPEELASLYQLFIKELGDFPDGQTGATIKEDLERYRLEALAAITP